jgi:hypothetical protein
MYRDPAQAAARVQTLEAPRRDLDELAAVRVGAAALAAQDHNEG